VLTDHDVANLKLRWGQENIHQAPVEKLYDPSSDIPHKGVACDGCDAPVIGYRYKSCHVTDFDLCSNCYSTWQNSETGSEGLKLAKDSVLARIPPNACSTTKLFYDDAVDAKINACGHSH
jgi:hypothetical protein